MKSASRAASVVACIVLWTASPVFADDDSAYLDELIARAEQQQLSEKRQWKTLLHYRRGLFGRLKSDVDAPEFFLSEQGKTDPQAELEATLAAFFEPARKPADEYDPEREHPQCRFRARYVWLDEQLDFDHDRLVERDCEDFRKWRDTLDAESATLIFADSYMNNPASMFGHTLLRLDRSEEGNARNLTSYVVNYAAEPWTNNPFLYTILGVTGGFEAYFTTLPFYMKTREYTDLESRDLWEYELHFDDEELSRMLRHLWELQPYWIDYFYFDENCSFHLLSLLEAADPSLHLTDAFSLHVIPTDTVREVLETEGLSGERTFRPSRRREMVALRERLTTEEARLARRLGRKQDESALEELDEFEEERQAAILEAAHALFRYLNESDEEQVDPAFEHRILSRRGEIDVTTPEVDIEEGTAPEEGHGTGRATVGGGVSESQGGFFEIGLRPALHDLGASDVGYASLSQIEFLSARLRGFGLREDLQAPSILLQRFDLLEIVSLAPLDAWDLKWSWGLKTGLERTYRDGCGESGCLMYDFALGFGGAASVGPLTGYLLADGQIAAGSTFDRNLRLAAGPRLGLLMKLDRVARLHLEGRYRYPLWGEGWPDVVPVAGGDQPPWSTRAMLSLSPGKNVETRLTGTLERGRTELGAAFHLYF
ncbi:MAG: DUF4105 domain-containing protein [Persicimonas sp.]